MRAMTNGPVKLCATKPPIGNGIKFLRYFCLNIHIITECIGNENNKIVLRYLNMLRRETTGVRNGDNGQKCNECTAFFRVSWSEVKLEYTMEFPGQKFGAAAVHFNLTLRRKCGKICSPQPHRSGTKASWGQTRRAHPQPWF